MTVRHYGGNLRGYGEYVEGKELRSLLCATIQPGTAQSTKDMGGANTMGDVAPAQDQKKEKRLLGGR